MKTRKTFSQANAWQSRKHLTLDINQLWRLNRHFTGYTNFSGKPNLKVVSFDLELLLQYAQKYHLDAPTSTPCLGDCLRLPDGQTVYFCYIYDDAAQTCGGGSFHLTQSGGISYSGGLDRGINFCDIELTKEKYFLPIWFSHRGHLCAGCAIYARIECRVWKTKEGADLTGIPQVRALRVAKLKAQSETVTKINGNGRKYKQHLPEIILKKNHLSEELFNQVQQATQLSFEDSSYFVPVYWCQPMTLKQIEILRSFQELSITETSDCTTYQPILMVKVKCS